MGKSNTPSMTVLTVLGNCTGGGSKPRLLIINLASVLGGQLVNSPAAQSLERQEQL
jgi:hypothetical protein